MIPKDKQNNQECIKAEADKLQKLLDFDVYTEVDDKGQDCISTIWVVTKNGEQVKARLFKGWTVKGPDIKSAFLQGKEIQRDVYIKPPCEAKRPAGKIWKLKKTLYGLNDAAPKFYDSIREELTNLGLVQSKADPSLFYKVNNGEIIGAIITHIDDFMHCGGALFNNIVIKHICWNVLFLESKKLTSFVALVLALIITTRKSH